MDPSALGNIKSTMDDARRRVIVVDNEPMYADTLELIMRTSGYDVTAAYSGEQAIEAACLVNPEVLITDVIMQGGINGIDAAVRIRKDFPNCKVILVSGQPATADLLRRADQQDTLGFEVLPKPVHPKVIIELART